MATYQTVSAKSVDRIINRVCLAGIDRVIAGGYGPAAEELVSPSRQPTTKESRSNKPDDTSDELVLDAMDDNAKQDWRPLTDHQKATLSFENQLAHSDANPKMAWLRTAVKRDEKTAKRNRKAATK